MPRRVISFGVLWSQSHQARDGCHYEQPPASALQALSRVVDRGGTLSPELTVAASFALASLVAWTSTPVAIDVARRTSFFDHPAGYKGHAEPTPYLGGAAIMLAVLLAALTVGGAGARFGVLFACAAGLWVVGTVDDRVTVRARWRIVAVMAVGAILWRAGLAWSVFDAGVLNLLVTVVWVLGIVNACNLLDNLDGATATIAGVSSGGAGVLALVTGDGELAALAFAVSGACVGFLPHNLAGPARIFLGDGGSMPIGLLVASVGMLVADGAGVGGGAVVVSGMLVAVFVFDTTLVVVSRWRQGIPLLTGGRDHVTHRLLAKLRSPGKVALALGSIQAMFCSLAILGAESSPPLLGLAAVGASTIGLAALVLLDGPSWRPKATWIATGRSV